MASVKILLFTHKKLKDGTHPIMIQVIKDRKRKLISLGHSAKKNHWNFDKNLPNSLHPHSDKLKHLIRSKRSKLESRILDLDNESENYDINDIIEVLDDSFRDSSFKAYSDQLIINMINEGRDGNALAYRGAQRAFLAFWDEGDIDIKKISPQLLERFQSHLLKKGRMVNSISVYLRTLRAIYNKAIRDKVISEKHYPFKEFKIKNEKTIKRAIPQQKMTEIKELDLSAKPELEKVRDIFLYSFYMRGMNFVDICYLKNKDINGERLTYRRRKTRQVFSIKIPEPARKIIDRYSDPSSADNYVFPIIKPGKEYVSYRSANRNYNKNLKEIGKKVNLDIPLTGYVARHSWATIAKYANIPTPIISEGMGHDSEKTTQIYLDSFEKKIIDDANEKVIENI